MVRELGLERRETVRSLSAVFEIKKNLTLVREDWEGLISGVSIIIKKKLYCRVATLGIDKYIFIRNYFLKFLISFK